MNRAGLIPQTHRSTVFCFRFSGAPLRFAAVVRPPKINQVKGLILAQSER